jgi:dipeptidyl aminopeptidase/acylaminoacyl peptidase
MTAFVITSLLFWSLIISGCKTDSQTVDTSIPFDKSVIVYQSYHPGTGFWRLFATTTDASARLALTPNLTPQTGVNEYAVSPAGVYVAYRLQGSGITPERLYIANVYTGATSEITGHPGAPTRASTFVWSPAGTHIAYIGSDSISAHGRLFIYDVTAMQSIQISPGETPTHTSATQDATPSNLQWSPNGAALAYGTKYDSWELNAIAPDGSNYRKLSGSLITGAVIFDGINWSPDSSRIAYLANQNSLDTREAFATNFDGSNNIRLSPPLDPGEDVDTFYWSPDSRNIAMGIFRLAPFPALTLYGSKADGTFTWNIATNVTVNGIADPYLVSWSPDSAHVAYRADHDGDNLVEYYSSDVSSFNVAMLSGTGTSGYLQTLTWSPTDPIVAYTQDADITSIPELYITDSNGSGLTKISGVIPATSRVREFSWNPSGDAIVYRVVNNSSIAIRVYFPSSYITTEIATNSPATVLMEPAWHPSTGQIIFVGDLDTPGVGELYVADTAGTVTKVSHYIDPTAPIIGEDVLSFMPVP